MALTPCFLAHSRALIAFQVIRSEVRRAPRVGRKRGRR